MGAKAQLSKLDEILNDQDEDEYGALPPTTSKPIPKYFDCLDTDLYFETNVPLELKNYTILPDIIHCTITYFTLNSAQIQILMYLHKQTLGFIANSHPFYSKITKKLPVNTVLATYGDFAKSKILIKRNRFLKTTARSLGAKLFLKKDAVHRAITGLEKLNILQTKPNKKLGTFIGINYLTLKALFVDCKPLTTDRIEHLEMLRDQKLIEYKFGRITVLKYCIESMILSLPRGGKRNFKQLNAVEKFALSRAFPNNNYLK